jgi:hypothetical protein
MDKKEQKRRWYEVNAEREKRAAAAYRLKNPDAKRSWLKENGSRPKVRFDKAKSNVKTKRRKDWTLTFEEYEKLITSIFLKKEDPA